jgi:amino acid adenylation domain-containing protein
MRNFMSDITEPSPELSATKKRELLAQMLQEQTREQTSLQPVEETHSHGQPLSYGQRALWFLYQMDPRSAAYNIMYAAHIRTDVDRQALQHAFHALVRRHAALRTTFATLGGLPMQQIHSDCDVLLEEIDARSMSWQQVQQRLEQEANRPFDLQQGPVFRIQLLQREGSTGVLLFTTAHIATDFWSFDLLFDELQQLYRANVRGATLHAEGANLAGLKYSYLSFVQWQDEMLQGPAGQRQWNYWREQLGGELPNLDLPLDHPRPPLQTYQGKSYLFKLPDSLTHRLFELSQAEKTTPFMTLLAAFQVLLYRWSGQQDILVGSPTAGRNRAEFESLVGYFLNPVVFRGRLQPGISFREFLDQVRQTVLDGLTHQDFPFPLLVERLQPPRDPSRSPVFQVSFAWDKPRQGFADEAVGLSSGPESANPETENPAPENTEVGRSLASSPPADPATLGLRPFALGQQGAAFDLTLMMLSVGDSLSAALQYNSDLFDQTTIARMAEHFQTLLESIADRPDLPVAKLPMLSESWRRQMLVEWNQTEAIYPHERLLHQLFEQRALETPEAVAASHAKRQWTYDQLNRRANQLARLLVTHGVGPDRHVGLLIEPSLEMLQAILAIHKAGGAYVPLAPGTPADRMATMLGESDVEVVLTQRTLGDTLPEFSGLVLSLDGGPEEGLGDAHESFTWQAIARESAENLDLSLDSKQLAYTIFTSGSTGRPKGVQVPHRAVVNFLQSMRREPGLTSSDRLLAVTTLSFDISVLEFYLPLTTGAQVVLVDRCVVADGLQLAKTLTDSRTTVMQATPATWRMLIEAGWQGNGQLTILCGGEALPRDLADRLLPLCGSLWNMYGPTETTIWSAVRHMAPESGPVSIGKPIDNTQLYLVDQRCQPVPVGVPGELLIAGDGLARGYLNQPELSAERFIPHPFRDDPGARAYRTGDLARYRPDGSIEVLGRLDFQVKIRGYRIELGEIETHLDRHPQVRQSVVVAQQMGPHSDDKQLVAYTIVSEPEPNVSQLRDFLRQQLPDYMLPAVFMTLEEFPLNRAGKVDRRALPEPDTTRPALQVQYNAPRGDQETALAEIWANVLSLDQVGRNDNFFELGGASIQSLEIAAGAAEVGLVFTPAQLFQYPTIAELAIALECNQESPSQVDEDGASEVTTVQTAACASSTSLESSVVSTLSSGTGQINRENGRPSRIPTVAGSQPAIGPTTQGRIEQPTRTANTVISSLGVYLPPGEVTTKELIQGCKKKIWFPLEYMTGIRARRMVDDTEFSIDLARKAALECLANSHYTPAQIDMVVCCNITRSDALHEMSMEPNTSMQVKRACGLTGAIAFDVTNACAGMFTGMSVVDAFISSGLIRRGLVVSGEYISGISRTAQLEISEFLDPRLACLTVGDAGAAVLLESSGGTEVGFHELDMYTLGKYAWMCIGRLTEEPHGGAIMMVPDPMEHTAVAVKYSVANAKHTFERCGRDPEKIEHLIMHQTSERSLLDGAKAINKAFKKKISTKENTINNLADRGNTASTSHMVALWDHAFEGRIQSGDNVVFGITGSGQTIGTAIYTLDDLPDRLRTIKQSGKRPAKLSDAQSMWPLPERNFPRVQIAAVGTFPEDADLPEDSVDTAAIAGRACLEASAYTAGDIGLLIFAGVTRTGYVSEPALATMVAGKLRMNDSIELETDPKTLAFDVYNGAMSFINGCQIATEMIHAGKFQTAMVVASEVEINKPYFPECLLGLAETGAAVILDQNGSGQTGFSQFLFHYDLEHFGAREAIGRYTDGKPCLRLKEAENMHALYLQAIPAAVDQLLAREGLERSQIKFLLPPQISSEMNGQLAKRLGIEPQCVVDRAIPGQDLYTASLAYSLQYLQQNHLTEPGDIGLIVQVASGIQVGCAVYYF